MTHRKKQVAIYARVSVEGQETGSSVGAQAAECVEFGKSLAMSKED